MLLSIKIILTNFIKSLPYIIINTESINTESLLCIINIKSINQYTKSLSNVIKDSENIIPFVILYY